MMDYGFLRVNFLQHFMFLGSLLFLLLCEGWPLQEAQLQKWQDIGCGCWKLVHLLSDSLLNGEIF